MRSGRKSGWRCGFTLVELQIAMLIMTMIALLLAGALRATVQAWQKSTEHQDVAEHRFMVGQFLRRHLNNMRFQRAPYSDGRRVVSFMGEPQQLHFVAPYPSFDNDGELYWWTLKNRGAEADKPEELILEYLPYSTQQTIDYERGKGLLIEDAEPKILVVDSGLRIEELDYFDQDEFGVGEWESDWEPGYRAPKVVRLQITEITAEGDERNWISLVVSPRFYHQRLAYE